MIDMNGVVWFVVAACGAGIGLGVLVQLADFIHRKALEEAREALLLQRGPARPLRSATLISALYRPGAVDRRTSKMDCKPLQIGRRGIAQNRFLMPCQF